MIYEELEELMKIVEINFPTEEEINQMEIDIKGDKNEYPKTFEFDRNKI